MDASPDIAAFYDEGTGSFSYVVADADAGRAAVIDPVLQFNRDLGLVSTQGADALAEHIRARGWTLDWILETHPHADHLTAAHYLKSRMGGAVGIGRHIGVVRQAYAPLFDGAGAQVRPAHGRPDTHFDRLWDEGDRFPIGQWTVTVRHVPGHTPADVAYLLHGVAFVGDTLFMPDLGTARADFAGGDARTLFRSIQALLALPPGTRLFVGHDYPPAHRGPACVATVAVQRAENIHVRDGIGEAHYVAMRRRRDAGLQAPALMLPALQVNMVAGAMPKPEANGTRYLKIPLSAAGLWATS